MDEFYKSIKNFDDAYNYLLRDSFKDDEKIQDLLSSYNHLHPGSYEEKVFKITYGSKYFLDEKSQITNFKKRAVKI